MSTPYTFDPSIEFTLYEIKFDGAFMSSLNIPPIADVRTAQNFLATIATCLGDDAEAGELTFEDMHGTVVARHAVF